MDHIRNYIDTGLPTANITLDGRPNGPCWSSRVTASLADPGTHQAE